MQRNKYTRIIYVFLILLMFGFNNETKATHIMGGDFSYVCLGNGQYSVNLRLFRDCNGITFSNTVSISATSSSCGTANATLTNLGGPTIRTPFCPSATITDVCNGGSSSYGIEEYLYRGTITLPAGCGADWIMSWSSCCRNFAITTLVNGGGEGTYISALINNTPAINCNNSPAFNNDPTLFLCANQENRYSGGAVDLEGDDLVYSFVNCLSNATNSVVYSPGLGGTLPLVASTQTVDGQTGEIIIVPTTVQVGVICLKVEEFRNGTKIGEIVRDLQFTVIDCGSGSGAENTLPTISGINGTADSSGTTGSYTIDVCAGTQVAFNIQGFDAESVPSVALQNLELEWNYGIQGASFLVDYNLPYPVAEFKWTPSTSDVGSHFFFIGANDDACPILGSNVYAYRINVHPLLTASITGVSPSDTINSGDTVLLDVSTSISPPSLVYSWTPTTGLSCTNCPNPTAIPITSTIYTVEITDNSTGCNASASIEINAFGVSTNEIPEKLSNWKVYPNPIIENSVIDYELSTSSEVTIELYDILGQRVSLIVNEKQAKGQHQYQIGQYLKGRATGIYFISMQVGEQQVAQKLILR